MRMSAKHDSSLVFFRRLTRHWNVIVFFFFSSVPDNTEIMLS